MLMLIRVIFIAPAYLVFVFTLIIRIFFIVINKSLVVSPHADLTHGVQ